MSRPLTTTSYAILGVLALRPWSAYDLTGYMRTSAIRNHWPRTESRLYAEPKNLVAQGLAKASKEYTGRRQRTVYRITGKGRKALAAWLGQRAAPPETQDEAVLKVLLADLGTVDQLKQTLRWALEDVAAQISLVREIADRVQSGDTRFPERLHINVFSGRNAVTRLRQRLEYLRWANDWVSTWEGTGLDEEKRKTARGVVERSQAELRKLDEEVRELLGEGEPIEPR